MACFTHRAHTALVAHLALTHRAALHCNHRWALDGCDPASYAGILWCFGGCLQWHLLCLPHAVAPSAHPVRLLAPQLGASRVLPVTGKLTAS